jgi:hypothetical protein
MGAAARRESPQPAYDEGESIPFRVERPLSALSFTPSPRGTNSPPGVFIGRRACALIPLPWRARACHFAPRFDVGRGAIFIPVAGEQVSLDALKIQIRSYCDAHPLAPYYGAVLSVYMSLPPVQ